MEHDSRVLRQLVPFFADDRDLARLGHEQLAELLQLSRGGVATGENAEVDADLEACGLPLDHEGNGFLDPHSKSYNRLGPDLTLPWLPAEFPQGNHDAEQSPAREDAYRGRLVPQFLTVEVDRVDRVEQVFER